MEKLTNIIESILFISGKAVAISDISERIEYTDREILKAAKELQEKYSDPCGINLLIFNNKLQFASNPKYGEQVSLVLNPIRERELSKSMLETAAIIAYKQPVTRLDLEEIRGNSEYAIQKLLEMKVIEVVGRKDAVGRPVLFGTTDEFLKRFQISSLDELPDYEELMARIRMTTGTSDSYLYKKPEYVEGKTDTPSEIDISTIKTRGEVNDEKIEEFEFPEIGEDVPDFLEGESYSVVSADDVEEDLDDEEEYDDDDDDDDE